MQREAELLDYHEGLGPNQAPQGTAHAKAPTCMPPYPPCTCLCLLHGPCVTVGFPSLPLPQLLQGALPVPSLTQSTAAPLGPALLDSPDSNLQAVTCLVPQSECLQAFAKAKRSPEDEERLGANCAPKQRPQSNRSASKMAASKMAAEEQG